MTFPADRTYGIGNGCGYGAFDSGLAEMGETAPAEGAGAGITVHGLVGSFDALLFKTGSALGEEEHISIGENSRLRGNRLDSEAVLTFK